jgi:glucose/arabinose dehydrogenase
MELDDFYQAGLFEVMLHPKYVENNFVYLTYAWGTSSENTLRLARAHFDGTSLKDLRVLFEVKPRRDTSNHYGGKMAFLPDGTLLLSVGEAFEYREKAQDLSTHFGKIIRLNDDGQVPADNPFAGREGARPEIFSLGHRNPQGLVFDAQRGTIYATEHGPQGGDEINIIEAGKNYGWPVITYGMDYSGAYVSPYTQRPGMEQPVLLWTPSMAPSGLAVYRGDKFPAWKGDLFVGSLAHKHLRRVHLDANGNVAGQEILMSSLKSRVREVREGPDGFLYVTTDERDNRGATGRVLRLEPGP